MKKTIIALFALSAIAMGDTTSPDKAVYGSDTLTLNQAITDTVMNTGITVVAKLNVITLKSYMTDSTATLPATLINIITGREDNARADLGVTAYWNDASESGLAGTWNSAGRYSFNMGSGTLGAEEANFWTNVTGASITLISKLEEGVAQGTGSTENKGCTALLTIEKTVDEATSYTHFGGQWYDGLYSSKINSVSSIDFDESVIGAHIYYSGVSVSDAQTLATNAIKNIPEPTTATLSLLALAGLAARRRRK